MYSNDLLWQVLFHFFITVVLVFGAFGLALGLGLAFAGGRTLRLFGVMNRWISTRGAFRALDAPRSTEPFSHRNRRWVGWALIIGGLFAAIGLVAGVNADALGAAFARGDMAKLLGMAAQAVKVFLVIGSIAGVAVGVLLCFFPDALARVERHANRWISPRQLSRGADEPNLTLDRLVEAHPASSGWILACIALGAMIYAVVLLQVRT